jgi:O-acetyl-ADP-ribose deacetylase (regulator of RNase III)
MIYSVTGDILLTRAQATAHGIAPNDNFATGLALSLRERWPAMYKDFRHYCHTAHPKAGGLWAWAGSDSTRIVNLFTQEPAYDHGAKPGKATVENVNHCLRELAKFIADENIASIALPRLATGVGGLDWQEVAPLIEKHLGALTVRTFLYSEFHRGMQAAEPGFG